MKTEEISQYQIKLSDQFFFDSNVWLYLYYPQSGITQKQINAYSNFLDSILSKNKLLVTDLLQISEVVNVIISAEYRDFRNKGNHSISLKDWKASDKFQPALDTAKLITSRILKQTDLVSGVFNAEEMIQMVSECDKADFNDLYFIRLAEKQSLNIVTHDFDFRAAKDFRFNIISANTNYHN